MKQMFKKMGKFMFGMGWALMAGGIVAIGVGRSEIVFTFILGLGIGLVTVGAVSIFTKWKNPNRAKQQEIDMKDERNIRIRDKAGYGTFVITMLLLVAMVITMLSLEQIITFILAIGVLVIHILSYFIVQSYYDIKL